MAAVDRSPGAERTDAEIDSYHQAYGDQLARAVRAEAALHRLEARIRSRDFAGAVELERAKRGAGDDEYNVVAMQDSIRETLDA
jgi:hypothetical protein